MRQPDISPVQSPVCGCHVFKTQLSQREVGSWGKTGQPGYSLIGDGFIQHKSTAGPFILCLPVADSSSQVVISYQKFPCFVALVSGRPSDHAKTKKQLDSYFWNPTKTQGLFNKIIKFESKDRWRNGAIL